MIDRLTRHRALLEPTVAALLLLTWVGCLPIVLSARGARGAAAEFAVILLMAASLGLTRFAPVIAVAAAAVALLGGVVFVAAGATMPFFVVGYLALLVTVARLAAQATRLVSRGALGVGVAVGPLAILGFALGVAPEFWPSTMIRLIGGHQGVALIATAMALSIGQVMAWLAGRRVQTDAGGTLVRPLARREWFVDLIIAALYVLVIAMSVVLAAAPPAGGVAAVIFAAALVVRRSTPLTALLLVWMGALAQILVLDSGPGLPDIAIFMVVYASAAYGDRLVRWASFGSAVLGAGIASLYLTVGNGISDDYFRAVSQRLSDVVLRFLALFVSLFIALILAWLLGLLARVWGRARTSRMAQVKAEAEQQRAEERVIVEQERNRIARDMHDVVAHSLAVVIAQSDGARYAARADPQATDAALLTISDTARKALGDVRLLLGELRHSQDAGPQPGPSDLPTLVQQMRTAGLDVRIHRSGDEPELGTAGQIAVYRIVQEALTNALRHGVSGAPVRLDLTFDGTGVGITVANEAPHPEVSDDPVVRNVAENPRRRGHGLPGMAERATLAGGWARTTERDHVFTVNAYIPAVSADTAVAQRRDAHDGTATASEHRR